MPTYENERAVHHARHDTVSEPWCGPNRMSNVYKAKWSAMQMFLLRIFLGVFGLVLLWMTMGNELWRQFHGDDTHGGLGSSTAEERNSSGHKWAADPHLVDEMNLDSKPFWQAYAADRYAMLTGNVSPKYLVFEPQSGLGNRMSGMMSTFVLSVAYDRMFLHNWEAGEHSCTAGYDDLFVPPFEPWFSSARVGDPMGSSETRFGENTTSAWQSDDRRNCSLDLTQAGVSNGDLDMVFLERRGEDPKPDCRVLFVKTNQYLVELLSSPAYGNATVGGVKLSEWFSNGMAIDTLFSGLFRPLPVIRQRVELTSKRVYPATMDSSIKTVAAHARSWQLRNITTQHRFVECLERWARSSNASSVVLATDMSRFAKESEVTLLLKGITVMMMEGVHRTGEGHEMRNSVKKIQDALAEMLLVGKANIIITSPKSSFSSLAAAQGGMSSQRVGGTSCTKVSNEPEFHLLGCKIGWNLDWAKWSSVYPFAEDIRRRCAN